MTAQEAFASMMRDRVVPALLKLGVRGSGQSFSIPSETHWALIGFQKSASSNAQNVRFTVNLTVVSREEWAEVFAKHPSFGAKPKPNVRGLGGWNERIGALLPEGADRWWQVEPDRPTEQVSVEVVAAISDLALPEMQRRMAQS
jgi:hypothetical protein